MEKHRSVAGGPANRRARKRTVSVGRGRIAWRSLAPPPDASGYPPPPRKPGSPAIGAFLLRLIDLDYHIRADTRGGFGRERPTLRLVLAFDEGFFIQPDVRLGGLLPGEPSGALQSTGR